LQNRRRLEAGPRAAYPSNSVSCYGATKMEALSERVPIEQLAQFVHDS
jgi:hypothetical protein